MLKPTLLRLGLISLLSSPLLVQAGEQVTNQVERPPVSNSSWDDTPRPAADLLKSPYQVSLFSTQHGEDGERLLSQTLSIGGYGLGVIGVLAIMPESVTNWEKDSDDPGPLSKWWDNVSSGPVWDRDVWYINYVGHPYFGGVYYQVARKSGYRQWDSFVYSFLMSSFYWEYGVEAFAEVPAVQDLIVTPVMGWVYGEWAYNKEREIIQSGGQVLGSDFLGSTALFFLDPVDSLGRGFNRLVGQDVVKAGTGYMTMSEVPMDNGQTDSQIQLGVRFAIGGGDAAPGMQRHQPSYYGSVNHDPVDYGIVGVSFGVDYMNYDDYWEVDDGFTPSASLGLYFTRRFSARLSYNRTRLDHKETGKLITMETFSMDGQYYFNPQQNLRPYLTAGIGETLREESNDDKIFQVNAGVGLHYRLSANVALQTDWRHYYSSRIGSHENQLGARLVYRFGKGERGL